MNQNVRILIVDDEPQMQLALKTALMRKGFLTEVASNGRQALQMIEAEKFDLVISDQRMPEMSGQELLEAVNAKEEKPPFIMITAHGTIDAAVKAMQLGAADFIQKPFSVEDLLCIVERVLSPENIAFRKELDCAANKRSNTIVTNDPKMIRVLEVAEAVAKSDATVLVQGESGTGKEGMSRFVHAMSSRSKNPFIAVNCAALPENLLESELFGHEKGAFTGAQNAKPGKFELAQGGTILLDEISEMDLALQAKLLRVLQERELDRVGGREPISIDVRVIATTNRNLAGMVKEGKFREDLYYRLNVIPLTLPALRDRKSDIKLLAKHFMKQFLGNKAPEITTEVLAALEAYPWPGNVRELQNAVQRASILACGSSPRANHFLIGEDSNGLTNKITVERIETEAELSAVRGSDSGLTAGAEGSPTLTIRSGMTVYEMEKSLILETLRANENNRTKAADLLGISIRTLRNKLNEYGLGRQGEGDEASK
jgi:two-component system response regulator FlrC